LAAGRGGGCTGVLVLQDAEHGCRNVKSRIANPSLRHQLARLPPCGTYPSRGLSVSAHGIPSRRPSRFDPAGPARRRSPPFSGCRWPFTVAIGGGAGLGAAYSITLLGAAYALEESAPCLASNCGATPVAGGIGTLPQFELGTHPPAGLRDGAAAGACPACRSACSSVWAAALIGCGCWSPAGSLRPAPMALLLRSHLVPAALAIGLLFALLSVASGGITSTTGSRARSRPAPGRPCGHALVGRCAGCWAVAEYTRSRSGRPDARFDRAWGPGWSAPGCMQWPGGSTGGPGRHRLPARIEFSGACRNPCSARYLCSTAQANRHPALAARTGPASRGHGPGSEGISWNEAQTRAFRGSGAPPPAT